jgi:S-adenosylmethionine hydrolase
MMKGVIAGIAPEVPVIDLNHSIPAGDIARAAFALWQSMPYFPMGTVFLTVVDPGVGTERRALAACWPEFSCVGPDNGLFTYLLAASDPDIAVELKETRYHLETPSATFHGRDIFAPVAAHLAKGVPPDQFGPQILDLVCLSLPALSLEPGPSIRGDVLHADAFGNLITSLGLLRQDEGSLRLEPWIPGCPAASLEGSAFEVLLPDGTRLSLRRTFGEVAPGEPLAYIGSSGLLEIGINRGRAENVLPLAQGQSVQLCKEG